MCLEFEDIRERIYNLLSDASVKSTSQAIKECLAKLQELLNGREDIFRPLINDFLRKMAKFRYQ